MKEELEPTGDGARSERQGQGHTPTPWAHEGSEIVTGYTGPHGKVIAIAAHGSVSAAPPLRIGDDDWDLEMANLGFIVRAANNHEALVSAARKAVNLMSYLHWESDPHGRKDKAEVFAELSAALSAVDSQ